MIDDAMHYDQMVESALRGVVRDSLRMVADKGLPGNHHFYISFRTSSAGVSLPPYLKAKYPEEMTVVMQHQFWDLVVEEEGFGITLSFNKKPEKLYIPFAAITAFADPSVQFGLQFRLIAPMSDDELEDDDDLGADIATLTHEGEDKAGEVEKIGKASKKDKAGEAGSKGGDDDKPGGNVVPLDLFRKK